MNRLMRVNAVQLGFILLAAGAIWGCGKHEERGASHAAVVDAQVTVQNQQQVLDELTGAVHRCWADKGRQPRTLDEVVAAGYLKAIPTPPTGKQFVINPRTVQVVLADL